MKTYHRVTLFLLAVLLLTCLLSPWAFALWNLIIEANPAWEARRYPFARIFDRLFMVLGITLFFPLQSWLKLNSVAQVGLGPLREGYHDLIKGFLLALGSVVALCLVMSLAGVFTPYFRLPISTALERSLKALLAGLTVGFFEELFFRGLIFKGLLEGQRLAAALLITNLFYSAIHFVKPAEQISVTGLDPWAGVHHLTYAFQPLLDPTNLLPGVLGLFLIGLVLSYAFLRTGSLYLSIGLHAGWIFGLKGIRIFGDYRRGDLGWIFGSWEPKILSGVATWIGILAVGVILHYATRRREGLRH